MKTESTTQNKTIVKCWRGRFFTDDNAFEEIFKSESEFFGYHEDDNEAGTFRIFQDDETGKFSVTQDNRSQDPTENKDVAGPFDTEAEALAAIKNLEAERVIESLKTADIYELPDGWRVSHLSDAESAHSSYPQAAYSAEVCLTNGQETVTGKSFVRGHLVTGSKSAETQSAVDAIEEAIKRINSGDFDEEDEDESED